MLLADFASDIEASRSALLPFAEFNYYKSLPDTLYLDFSFLPAAYYINSSDGHWWPIAANGEMTVSNQASPSANARVIYAHSPSLEKTLGREALEPILHQSLLDLFYWLDESDLPVQRLDFYDYNHLEITMPEAVYLVTTFSLDQDLQRVAYVHHGYRHESDTPAKIDARVQRPTIKINP